MLQTNYPDFRLAEKYAQDWARLRQTVFSKTALCRIYLHWLAKGIRQQDRLPDDLEARYRVALTELKAHPGGIGAFHEVLAEEAEMSGDIVGAVRELENAISYDNRVEIRLKRWQVMAKHRTTSEVVLSELEALKADSRQAAFADENLKRLTEIFVTALDNGVYSAQRLNRFAAPLPTRDIGRIVTKARRR